ncbi:DUF3598 family protein [Oscillatoria sp. FACHB-1406]|uniref:DUF3598 family protein n=1 Tax=Oscillatoria sp. FACHB-1406 TaxID=2692846 RepID=UPI00322098CA
MMSAQWENFLKNLGEWQGSFAAFSPEGELLGETPSVVSLIGSENNQKVSLTVRYLPPDEPPKEIALEYTQVAPKVLFFETGAFSQGSFQWGPYSEFGAEFGLIEGDRRLRAVMLYDRASQCNRITLIRERLPHSTTPDRPPLTVEQLAGTWEGQATTLYPDYRNPSVYPTRLSIAIENENRIQQKLEFGDRVVSSTGEIQGSRLLFNEGALPIQILLLPDGGSANCPQSIQRGHPFILEMGWLLEPQRRQRLIRSYNAKGEWMSLTLLEEQKVN